MKPKIIVLLSAALLLLSACGTTLKTDKEMKRLMDEAVKNCEIDTRYASIKGCNKGKELRTVTRDTPVDIALNTASIALNSENKKMRAVACFVLYMELKNKRYQIKKMAKKLNSAMVDNLLSGMKKYPTYVMLYAADAVTYTATLTGRSGDLLKLLNDYPVRQVQQAILSKLMTYGRTEMIPVLKKWAKDKNKYVSRAALRAPQYMYKYTPEEKKAVAGWMSEVFKLGDNYEKSIAGKILYNKIGGKYADTVLDYIEKEIPAAETAGKAPWELRRLAYGLWNKNLSETQIKRAKDLKEKIKAIKKK